MSSFDENPGVNLDEYQAEWESLMDDVRDDPYNGVPELERLVERMLADQGLVITDPVAMSGADPELAAGLAEVRRITQGLREGADVPPADIAAAFEGLEDIYESLLPESTKPMAGLRGIDESAAAQIDLEADAADTGETQPDDDR
jgi:hypothetical protein